MRRMRTECDAEADGKQVQSMIGRRNLGDVRGCVGCATRRVLRFCVLRRVRHEPRAGRGTSRKLTLKEAVSLAVANSRDLALARLQYGVVQRQVGVARSAFLPNLYTGTGVPIPADFRCWREAARPPFSLFPTTQQIFNPPLKGEQRAAEQRAEEQRLSMDDVRDAVMVARGARLSGAGESAACAGADAQRAD